jgi:hypothetical protein
MLTNSEYQFQERVQRVRRMPMLRRLAFFELCDAGNNLWAAVRMAETRGVRLAVTGYDLKLVRQLKVRQRKHALSAVAHCVRAAALLGIPISFPAPSQKKAALEC